MPDSDHPIHAGADDDHDIGYAQLQLEKIPRRLWEQALAPYRRQQRYFAATQVPDEGLREQALELAREMDFAAVRLANDRLEAGTRARRTAAPLPVPDGAHPVSRSTLQINVRLRHDDHARLADAAAFVGLRPTTLARALVLNGVAKILQERAT
jgi:hypothetical protein